MDRRRFLVRGSAAVAVGLVAAGCTDDAAPGPAPTGPSAPSPDPSPAGPDLAVRATVAEAEVALIVAYREALAATPALATQLRPLLAHHEAHLARVDSGASARAASTPAASRYPEASEPAAPEPVVPVERLAELEAEATLQRIRACNGASDPDLARVLCLIAASEAQHVEVLEDLARQLRAASR